MFHESKYLSRDIIHDMIDIDPNKAQIIVQQFICPMSDELGSKTCNNFLSSMSEDAKIDNLVLDSSQYAVDALW